MNLFEELAKPFPEDKIHWRAGATNAKAVRRKTGDQNAKPTKAVALAYIDARDVMDRLDFVAGPENWQCRYPFTGCCEIGIKVNNEWIWKSNGAGQTDIDGEKGQFSDSFKRAAVMWGIGRYLYSLPNEWFDLDDFGKFKTKPKLPQWATTNGWLPPNKVKGKVQGDIVDLDKVQGFVDQALKMIDDEDEEKTPAMAKKLYIQISTDERMEFQAKLKEIKYGKKMAWSIFHDYLTIAAKQEQAA